MEFRDLKIQYQKYQNHIDSAIKKVIQNANFIGGDEVDCLEKRLAEYVNIKHCISCANGTEAMTLVLMAWGIREGDAVFIPNFTFFSTGEVVSFVGATPVFVDVEKDTFNMDPQKLREAILKVNNEGLLSPKVIIPVDLFGLPAKHYEIEAIAKSNGLKILEDGAQGFGGSINGRRACSFGNASTTSFFPAKPLGCYGDGGAIFTNDDDLALLLRSLKNHGKGMDKYDNIRIGVNSRLDTLQASILNVKLTAFIDHELNDVNRVYQWYDGALKNAVIKPKIPEGYVSSFAQYTIRLKSIKERQAVEELLKSQAVPTMIYYSKPMHKQGAFIKLNYSDDDFINTIELCDTVLSLPMHPYLQKEEVEYISDLILKALYFSQ